MYFYIIAYTHLRNYGYCDIIRNNYFSGELKMNCENIFCIYQSKSKCILENVDINNMGMCADCIYPDIDEKLINDAKSELLKKYENAQET